MKDTPLYRQVQQLNNSQRAFYQTGKTLPVAWRKQQLLRLYKTLEQFSAQLEQSLAQDLGKSPMESWATEIGMVLAEIRQTVRQLNRWAKPRRQPVPMMLQPASGWVVPQPKGVVLILGPFNYPVQLLLVPLVGAIAAGNCATLSCSELVPNTARVLKQVIAKAFEPEYVAFLEGGKEPNTCLLDQTWDHIFFTGSERVGRIVMQAAANKLTPITLELGGKSPVIVDATANLDLAAQRIVWGKFINAGQTCVAPDYLLVQESIAQPLLQKLRSTIQAFYGQQPASSADYGRIVTQQHTARLADILKRDKALIWYGGQVELDQRLVAPTILYPAQLDSACMEQELFGPILPVLVYKNLEQALGWIGQRPTPLALYLFSGSKQTMRRVMESTSSGGMCINDTVNHLLAPSLPFGGKGPSGMGAYHGKHSFDTFSHQRSVLRRTDKMPLTAAYPPYTSSKLNMVKRLLR
ncbi:aldehyde dehydrogenase [uncultured Allofournierella sp.]|uniref:aldehyde dehydrogenase n=1 Tax=uncultured Allofournierella sp. TaxID=1940258 RepID=UPI003752AA5F